MKITSISFIALLKWLQAIFILAVILYFGKTLFIPLCFGLLTAIVLYPVCRKLEQRKWPKSIAVTVCLLLVTFLIIALVGLFIWQINEFKRDAPLFIDKLKTGLSALQQSLLLNHGLSIGTPASWVEKLSGNIGSILQSAFSGTVNMFFILFLVPVFTALFLYHRKIFVQSLRLIAGEKYRQRLDTILQEAVHTYFNYIKGMVMVYIIVGILNSAGLLLLGIKHAILFGMLCAVMTIIPYIGIIVSALLPISVAWITTGSIWYPLAVIAILGIVQYLEANIIFPKVVGTQLNISTWATLVAIIAGGIIWGVAGMILFIPFVAILKIITDKSEEWKSLNLLLNRNQD